MSVKNFKVYTASAGSGKTFQLTVDYLKIALREPETKFKKILAITFTKKATKEMKARILEACEAFSRINEVALDGRNSALLETLSKDSGWSESEIKQRSQILYKKIIHNYSDFSVSTIDSFTQRLLRSFAFELNIPLNFEVELDQADTMDLIVSRLLEKVGEKDKELTTLVQAFFDEKLNESDSVKIKDDFLKAANLMVNDVSIDARANLETITVKELIQINKKINDRYYSIKSEIVELGKQGLTALTNEGLVLKDTSRSCANFFQKLSDGIIVDKLSPTFLKRTKGDESWFKKGSPYVDSALDSMLSNLAAEYLNLFGTFKIVKQAKKSFTQVSLIAELYRLYKQYQHEEDILLIAEANQLISKEIKGQPAPFLYEKVGERYQHVLIDEFQDTSILQWHNLTPLVTEIMSQPGENECIVVGDSKQAIYRFRGGETKQLTMLPRLIGDDEDLLLADQSRVLERHHKPIEMEFNFRSEQQIVAFNNLLYKFVSEHNDLQSLHEIFSTYKQKTVKKDKQGYVQIDFVERPKKSDNVDESYDDLVNKLVLEQIADIKQRNFALGGVAILCKNNDQIRSLATLLAENNYKIESQEALALGNKKYLQLFFSLLSLFNDRSNQILQVEVATGFIKYGILNVNYATINEEIASRNIKNLEDFDELLKIFSTNDISLNTIDVSEILDVLELYISWLPSEIQQSDYISFFRNKLFDFVQVYGNNVHSLISWWEQKGNKTYIESTPDANAIQLMTIHKSKGLEFDFVLMPYTNWFLHYSWDSKWLPVKELGELPINHFYLSTSFDKLEYTSLQSAAEQNIQDVLMDHLNVLYVATTRAVKELYIIAEKQEKDVGNLKKPRRISALFNAFINDEHSTRETYGEKVQAEPEVLQKQKSFVIEPEVREFGKTEVVIKNRSNVIWSDEIQDRIDFGEIIHKLLEEISTPQSIRLVVNKAINEGLIQDSEQQNIQSLIEDIVNHAELKPYFSSQNKILAEQSIITPEGREYIPDRILIEDDGKSAKLIDFKTGELRDTHTRQLLNYSSLLEDMGFVVVEKKLVYVNPLFIKQL